MPGQVQGPAYYFPSIEKKYGKPVSYWLDLINSSELTKHKALVDWLKASYGIGHGHATALAGHALTQRNPATPEPAAALHGTERTHPLRPTAARSGRKPGNE
jgi:hypothetical protein